MTGEEVIEKVEKETKGLMTAEDLEKWNEERIKNLRPLRAGHWLHKARKRRRQIMICLEWRHWCQYWRAKCGEVGEEKFQLEQRVTQLEKANEELRARLRGVYKK